MPLPDWMQLPHDSAGQMSAMRFADAQDQEGQPQLHVATIWSRIIPSGGCAVVPLSDRHCHWHLCHARCRAYGLLEVEGLEMRELRLFLRACLKLDANRPKKPNNKAVNRSTHPRDK